MDNTDLPDQSYLRRWGTGTERSESFWDGTDLFKKIVAKHMIAQETEALLTSWEAEGWAAVTPGGIAGDSS